MLCTKAMPTPADMSGPHILDKCFGTFDGILIQVHSTPSSPSTNDAYYFFKIWSSKHFAAKWNNKLPQQIIPIIKLYGISTKMASLMIEGVHGVLACCPPIFTLLIWQPDGMFMRVSLNHLGDWRYLQALLSLHWVMALLSAISPRSTVLYDRPPPATPPQHQP